MRGGPSLTVFTCTYNRAYTIARTYDSLCCQTCKDFLWLVIDDGSTDNTKELVKGWMEKDNGFGIRYEYKENGGLHTGYNKAIELMNTEICVCVDSDDWMPVDAVDKIRRFWFEKGSERYAGIVGLDFIREKTPIGGYFPDIEHCHYYDLAFKYHHFGDDKIVIRVDLFKQVAPQPTFKGEKNFNPQYMISKIDLQYEWLLLNDNLCFVEYQETGMARGIFKQYLNSPNSFAAIRIENFKVPQAPFLFYIKQYIHLASSAIIAKDFSWLTKAPNLVIAYLFLPFGFILSLYIRHKAR